MSIASARLLDYAEAVLFDLDGTLLDTARDLVNALHIVCEAEHQPAPDVEIAARYVSTGAIGLVRLAFPEHDEAALELLRQRLVTTYEQNLCVHTAAYPGMGKVLDELDNARIPWGVVTNKMKYLAEPILEHLDLLRRCATVVGGDTAAQNKPHPAPIHFALEAMQIKPDRAVTSAMPKRTSWLARPQARIRSRLPGAILFLATTPIAGTQTIQLVTRRNF